jgi:hypothetical protein
MGDHETAQHEEEIDREMGMAEESVAPEPCPAMQQHDGERGQSAQAIQRLEFFLHASPWIAPSTSP